MKYYVNYLLIIGIALTTFMLSLGIRAEGGGWLVFLGIILVLCGILVAKNVEQKENER